MSLFRRIIPRELRENLLYIIKAFEEEQPWVQVKDIRKMTLSLDSAPGWDKAMVIKPLHLLLCFNPVAQQTLYDLCLHKEVFRERVTAQNYERIAAKRFSGEDKNQCAEAFKRALEKAQASQRDPQYSMSEDEALHVYYAGKWHWEEKDDCRCEYLVIEVPEGVIPTPIPEPKRGKKPELNGIPNPA